MSRYNIRPCYPLAFIQMDSSNIVPSAIARILIQRNYIWFSSSPSSRRLELLNEHRHAETIFLVVPELCHNASFLFHNTSSCCTPGASPTLAVFLTECTTLDPVLHSFPTAEPHFPLDMFRCESDTMIGRRRLRRLMEKAPKVLQALTVSDWDRFPQVSCLRRWWFDSPATSRLCIADRSTACSAQSENTFSLDRVSTAFSHFLFTNVCRRKNSGFERLR